MRAGYRAPGRRRQAACPRSGPGRGSWGNREVPPASAVRSACPRSGTRGGGLGNREVPPASAVRSACPRSGPGEGYGGTGRFPQRSAASVCRGVRPLTCPARPLHTAPGAAILVPKRLRGNECTHASAPTPERPSAARRLPGGDRPARGDRGLLEAYFLVDRATTRRSRSRSGRARTPCWRAPRRRTSFERARATPRTPRSTRSSTTRSRSPRVRRARVG